MSFNTNKFRSEKFTSRIGEVSVESLKAFFEEDEKPVFSVRGLSGVEFGRAREIAKNSDKLFAAIEGIQGGIKSEQVKGFQELLGVSGDAPPDVAEKIEIVRAGVVSPELTRADVALICERFPVIFFNVANKIIELTGMGQTPGKPVNSGEIPE